MSIELRGIPVVFFEENGVIIAHCVSLDVSSCGHDIEEAKCNIRDAIEGFIEVCRELDTLDEVLEESGFVKEGQKWTAPILLNSENVDVFVQAA